jgi:hypothetical protein
MVERVGCILPEQHGLHCRKLGTKEGSLQRD